ncbi:adenylate/guanylate cyclase domain-containing protein [Chachezhania sediminis]|uniref:adenylate/guanylate cyclase domain-containing protein n=1 Tax=Chachezhania sediminis TaxID=2599291 RepID=UPI001E32D57B|nr:adenylate/guanylate cyclase domain-containing protein [Chachezhania sediminis]
MNALWHGNWATRARIVSGLILFLFALTHFLNLGLGLFSSEWLETAQVWRKAVTRSGPGSAILALAALVHVGLAFRHVLRRRSLRIPFREWAQIGLGFLIPVFLIAHVVHTHVAAAMFDVDDQYAYLIALIWGTRDGLYQTLLILIVWTHACIGLRMWLRAAPWWDRAVPYLSAGAVMVPAFAMTGYLVEGRRIAPLKADPDAFWAYAETINFPDAEAFATLARISGTAFDIFLALVGSTLLWQLVRQIATRRRSVRIRYIDGPEVLGRRGATLLEMSRANGVPHTALCGGRGRCSTCRVIVEDGAAFLPPPDEAEARTLRAVGAPTNARLACQISPENDLAVFRVFQPDGKRGRAHASQGEERRLAILFLDMRGFTARTSGQLPYDVVFLLNRFFDAVVPPIMRSGGTVDKYLGDGFLAVFEAPDAATSARDALEAVRQIGTALEAFNAGLARHGDTEIKIGVGLHLGLLVLGEIGAAGNAPRTLIGDTVNIASRLEAMTKEAGVELLVSAEVLTAAGFDPADLQMQDFELRGLDHPMPALPVPRCAGLDECLAATAGTAERTS